MDITDLPNDIFLMIISYLSPTDCIRSRLVSRKWQCAFTDSELTRHILLQHYPRVREVRDNLTSVPWSAVLSRVAARYHHLNAGQPRCTEKLRLLRSLVVPEWARYQPVGTWQRHLQFEEKTAKFHYPDPLWTYDDGLLLFPSAEFQSYVLYDLHNGTVHGIVFNPAGKIVRRIRLKERVIIFEWCEESSHHQLNETETVFRHFATAIDILTENGALITRVRNEWKIHFLGLPLNSKDRFYSSHTSSHYALYLWQPNRSAWGEDDPIEALAIWDISSTSLYRPSEDPSGKLKPNEELEGPRVIRRLSFAELDFYTIRQRSTPTIRSLELDENHAYVVEEDHRWLVGQEAGHYLPRLHKVRSVGIPFSIGPRWEDSCGADGDVNLSFCERASETRSPRYAPCWRHEEFPYLTITEAMDTAAGVRFCARHCFMLETISISVKPKIHLLSPNYETSKDDLWSQLLGVGKICGDERWLIGENLEQEIVILHFDKDVVQRQVLQT